MLPNASRAFLGLPVNWLDMCKRFLLSDLVYLLLFKGVVVSDYMNISIGVNDAARLMGVRTSELKEAINEMKSLRGVEPPQPRNRITSHRGYTPAWIFRAGDVMDVAEKLKDNLAKKDV